MIKKNDYITLTDIYGEKNKSHRIHIAVKPLLFVCEYLAATIKAKANPILRQINNYLKVTFTKFTSFFLFFIFIKGSVLITNEKNLEK